jgi:hypothetical protein
MVGSSPSGMLPTSSPIANTAAAEKDNPAARVPRGRNATPIPTATSAMIHATRRTSRSNGLSLAPTFCDRAAMRPSWVCIPVANTTARASPAVHVSPLKTRSDASRNAPSPKPVPGARATGTDSPVSVDVSTSRLPCRRRASAETRSPSARTRMSPGTSSAAAMTRIRSPLTTVARGGRNLLKSSTARSACCSCTNANTALSTITATIAPATASEPVTADSPAANHNNSANGCVSWLRRSRGHDRPRRRDSSFRP